MRVYILLYIHECCMTCKNKVCFAHVPPYVNIHISLCMRGGSPHPRVFFAPPGPPVTVSGIKSPGCVPTIRIHRLTMSNNGQELDIMIMIIPKNSQQLIDVMVIPKPTTHCYGCGRIPSALGYSHPSSP